MPTECSAKPMGFARVDGRAVVADFDGGEITSNAGGLLLGATDRAIGLVERFAACFADSRAAERVVHEVATLVGQRVFGIALGYEDLIDHDQLRHDPVLGVVLGRLEARHGRCAPLAGKSTLNRLEHGAAEADRYRRIAHDGAAIEALFVDLFLDAHARRRRRSCSISTPPTTRCTATRRGGSSTATTTATATCRSTSSAAGICWRRSSGAPTSTPRPARSRRWRASSANPRPLAAGADRPARRRRLRAGAPDGLVRGQPGRLPVRPRAQPAAGRAHPRRARLGRARRRDDWAASRRNCQTFSTGFSSGERGGSGRSVRFPGTTSAPARCHPARLCSTGPDSPVSNASSQRSPCAVRSRRSAGTRLPASRRTASPGTSLPRIDLPLHAVAQHGGVRRFEVPQRPCRLACGILLNTADDAVQQQHCPDEGRVLQVAERRGDERGGEQDVDQRA